MFTDINYNTKMGRIINYESAMDLIILKSMMNNYNSIIYSDDSFDLENKKAFIKSLLLNFPMTPIFYHRDKYNKFIVLDGNKRLDTIFKFLKNEFSVNFTGNELFFKNIDKTILRYIKIKFIDISIDSNNPEVKLNTLKNILYSFGKEEKDVNRIINFIKSKY